MMPVSVSIPLRDFSFQHNEHTIKYGKLVHRKVVFGFYYPIELCIGKQKAYTVGYYDGAWMSPNPYQRLWYLI